MKNAQDFYKIWDQYCWFMNPANGFGLFTEQEYAQYQDECAQHEAEMDAESAWLRRAEMATYDDIGFEQWEHSRLYN